MDNDGATQSIQVEDFWWEGDTLCVKERDTGSVWYFKNTYPVSVKFGELEMDSSESTTIQLTHRWNGDKYERQQES